MSKSEKPPKELTVHPTGSCFDDVVKIMMHLIGPGNPKLLFSDRYMICHGICHFEDGRPYAHAWVEDTKEEAIYQGGIINGEPGYFAVHKKEFLEKYAVTDFKQYRIMEAVAIEKKTKMFGPWEERYRRLTKDFKEKES